MPVGSFKWVEKTFQNILDTSDESDQGYFVMVDLCYPKDLYDLHNDFPLAAEKLKIRKHYLLDYQKQFYQRETETAKLMETLFDKVNYVCHYSVLTFYVQQGMRVTKLHKTLQFCQSSFLKPYIDLNTTKRQEHGISEFKKNLFKLLINSCFGKTMENLRRRKSLIMVSNEKKAKFYCNKFNFNRLKIFKDDLVAVTMVKKIICWNKPTYLGAAILDVSKLQLYKFHFEEMVPRYGTNARVLYKDTDSIFYEIETEDVYKESEGMKNLLDLSSYPENPILYCNQNKKVPLKITDELNGNVVSKAVFLKPNAYSIAYVEEDAIKLKQSAKGVNKIVKSTLYHEKFKSVLLKGTAIRESVKKIVSELHFLSIAEVSKIALSAFDNKRFYDDDGIHSLAFGHFRTGQKRNCSIDFQRNELHFVLQDEDYCMANKCDDYITDKINGQNSIIADTDHTCQSMQSKKRDWDGSFDLSESDKESEGSFTPPDPGLVRTADESSDEEFLVDWEAPIYEKPYLKCSRLN